MNRLHRLRDAGQSIWLDFIERALLRDGNLERRIEEDAITGMTSNPTIFEKALAEGTDYDEQLRTVGGRLTAPELFEAVATTDVRDACDAFRPAYDRTGGADGYVSIEVSPGAANDSAATVAEAHRLWRGDDRTVAAALRGRAAIANAKLAYRLFRREFSTPRWAALRARGARVQRPLWASTSTKNPAYRDVMYVEQLIGRDTVNTMPPATIEAFRDHGEVARTVDANLEDAEHTISDLAALGISMR